jgi:hypothetical protein
MSKGLISSAHLCEYCKSDCLRFPLISLGIEMVRHRRWGASNQDETSVVRALYLNGGILSGKVYLTQDLPLGSKVVLIRLILQLPSTLFFQKERFDIILHQVM